MSRVFATVRWGNAIRTCPSATPHRLRHTDLYPLRPSLSLSQSLPNNIGTMPTPILKPASSTPDTGRRKYTTFSSWLTESPERSSSNQQHNPADPPSGWHLPNHEQAVASKTPRSTSRNRGGDRGHSQKTKQEERGKLSLWKLMALTVSMGGSQVRVPLCYQPR